MNLDKFIRPGIYLLVCIMALIFSTRMLNDLTHLFKPSTNKNAELEFTIKVLREQRSELVKEVARYRNRADHWHKEAQKHKDKRPQIRYIYETEAQKVYDLPIDVQFDLLQRHIAKLDSITQTR
jgi:uncharacterized coiled-coil DUF342 family protein